MLLLMRRHAPIQLSFSLDTGSCLFFRVLALRRAAHGGPWDINCSQGVQVTNAAVVFGD